MDESRDSRWFATSVILILHLSSPFLSTFTSYRWFKTYLGAVSLAVFVIKFSPIFSSQRSANPNPPDVANSFLLRFIPTALPSWSTDHEMQSTAQPTPSSPQHIRPHLSPGVQLSMFTRRMREFDCCQICCLLPNPRDLSSSVRSKIAAYSAKRTNHRGTVSFSPGYLLLQPTRYYLHYLQ